MAGSIPHETDRYIISTPHKLVNNKMTASEVIQECLDYLDDPDQTVHTQTKMLRALNRALSRVSSRSRSIAVNRVHRIVADQYEYPLPPRTLQLKRAKYLHTPQYPPLKRRRYDYVETLARGYPGTPRYYAFAARSATERGITTVRQVNTNQVFQIDGSNVSGVKPGDILVNLTATLPEAAIFEVNSLADPMDAEEEAALQIVTLDAIGGSSGRGVQVGDQVRIISPDTQGFSIAIAPRPSESDAEGVESLSVFVVVRHREITQFDIDSENDELSIDPDLEQMVVYETLHYASLAGETREDLGWKQLANDQFEENIANVRDRVAESLNAWESDYGGYGGLNEDTTLKAAAGSYNDYTVL